MTVFDLASKFDAITMIQVRHVVTDKLIWEGLAGNLKNAPFIEVTCIIDLIKPSFMHSGEFGHVDFEVFIHYDNEYPQTILSKATVERFYPWGHDREHDGVVTGYSKLTNEHK